MPNDASDRAAHNHQSDNSRIQSETLHGDHEAGCTEQPKMTRAPLTAEQWHKDSGIVVPLYAIMDKESGQVRVPRKEEILASIYSLMEAHTAHMTAALQAERDQLKITVNAFLRDAGVRACVEREELRLKFQQAEQELARLKHELENTRYGR